MAKLTDDQKQAVKGYVAEKAVSAVAKPLIKRVGDKMASARKPFWRKLVALFRGGS
jgi:hypothetical protein